MGILSNLFKKDKDDICTDKNSQYYGYPNDLKEFCEYNDKYQHVWDLVIKYTEKINYYYSNYINTNKKEDFDNLFIYCKKYIDLLPQLEEAKREDTRINKIDYPTNPYCIAYHKLAMAYEKSKCYNSAINICNDAISQGYSDGTKGGFEARIRRIKKKQAQILKQ